MNQLSVYAKVNLTLGTFEKNLSQIAEDKFPYAGRKKKSEVTMRVSTTDDNAAYGNLYQQDA